MYALALVAAGALMFVLPLGALAANIDLSNSRATISCAEGETATIAGSYDTVAVRGHCGTIAIDGDGDVVHADRVDRVTVVGNSNTIYYAGSAPQLDVRDGTNDAAYAASAQNAKLAAAAPPASASARMLSAGASPTPAPAGTANPTSPVPAASASLEPVATSISASAAQAAAFEGTAGAQLGPADVALNGGNASDSNITIVVGDGASYDANCANRTIEIGGDNGKVTLHGHCRFIRLSGNNVSLAFDEADGLVVTGNQNTTRYASRPGSTEMFGIGNVVASR